MSITIPEGQDGMTMIDDPNKPTETSVCSNGLLVCDIPTLELNTRLKEQWSPYHKGACHLLSKGHYCKCHLCLVDELTSRALGKAD